MHKVKKYVNNNDFTPEAIKKVSSAAGALCIWVHAIFIYGNVAKEVAPKKARLKKAEKSLAVKQEALAVAKAALAEVIAKVDALKKQYDDSVGEKNRLRSEAEELESKLNRAEQLVSGLSGEYTRWQASIGGFEQQAIDLTGDSLIAAGFLSYAGPFDATYREELVSKWSEQVKIKEIPRSPSFSFSLFLARPTDVRDWQLQGLPADAFSTENGVTVARGTRWPLMIDPQGQANRWVKNMEGNELKVIDLKQKDFLRDVENAIQFGMPVLLQDVLEELDPSLEPVLNKSIRKIGNRLVIKIGDKDVDYSKDFKFYITTKLANPHYTPEVSTKTTVVNFAVKQQGLEAQLLGIVVQKEEPQLEDQKSELTMRVAAGKRKLVELEDEILRLLSETKGSLLDDENLVNTLQVSKVTSSEVTEQLVVAEETEKKIDLAREGYRTAANRAAIVYFVLNDLARVDPMYQYSLDSYVEIFVSSIERSRDSNPTEAGDLIGRNKAINLYHTYATYTYTCRGLFERHKLLFSFQLCTRVLQGENKILLDELNFFLFGGNVLDKDAQMKNPCPDWVDEIAWDNLTELEKLNGGGFAQIASGFDQMRNDWHKWYMSVKPEETPLPGVWENKCSQLQRMLILRSLRQDRVLFAASTFISENLGPQFTDPPAFDLAKIFVTSTTKTPLIFVLSPGVDPTADVFQLAEQEGQTVNNCALGQGQAPVAVRLIEEGLAEGTWVLLANCHLMLSWMPTLENIVETYCTDPNNSPHPKFRLWLSSSPHPKFPISILQRGVKMTTEPPSGLRANLGVLYNSVTESQFARCGQQFAYKKLLFALAWFHAVLLERRKFKNLGFSVPYDFNQSDFAICHDLIIVFLDEYPDKTPWDAMRYLISEANYGGRVTDDWDRRLVNSYIAQYFCPEALEVNNFPLSALPEYFLPPDGQLDSHKDYIKTLPLTDLPEAFGQHRNAEINSQISDTKELLQTVVSLQPKMASEDGESAEDAVLRVAVGLEEQVPSPWNAKEVRKAMSARSDPDPLKTVLYQETDRYSLLVTKLRKQLHDLQLGVQGLVVITPELETVSTACQAGFVPDAWGFCYPSLKPLGSWMRDLVERCQFMNTWIETALPKVFWLTAFTYPTGFLTALLQTTARKNGIAIDTLNWEFPIQGADEGSIAQHPKEGAYIKGLFLEGARWDFEKGNLSEPAPMELFCLMPIIHFKPAETKKKSSKGMYNCPVYMYPIRTGSRERPSFMIAADIKAGAQDQDFWTKRGVAMLLSLAS
jgi:dynein heavy chain